MFFTTWTLDQSISKVEETNTAITIIVEDLGLSPFPSPVTVTYANGETVTASIPVSEWLSGKKSATLKFKAGAITRVEIDKCQFLPDLDRKNNVWENSFAKKLKT